MSEENNAVVNTNPMGLNFKYGQFAKLPKEGTAPGTIYITSDEKAMYVDLGGDIGRIRIGQIINLETSEWENLTPPYSTEAFYYLTDSNALLKYNSTAGWIQINSTQDIKNIIGFAGVVSDLPDAKDVEEGTIYTKKSGNSISHHICTKDAEDKKVFESIDNFGKEYLNIIEDISSLSTDVTSISGTVDDLTSKTTQLENVLNKTVTIHSYNKKFSDGVPSKDSTEWNSNWKEYDIVVDSANVARIVAKDDDESLVLSNASNIVTELSKRIEEVALAAGDATAVEELQTLVASMSGTIDGILDGETLDSFSDVENAIAGINTDITTNYLSKTEFAKEKSEIDKEIGNAKTTAENAQQSITGILADATIKTFKDVENAIAGINTDITTNYLSKTDFNEEKALINKDIGDAKTTAETAKGSIDAVLDGASANLNTFKAVEDKFKDVENEFDKYSTTDETEDLISDAVSPLSSSITSLSQSFDSFQKSIDALVYKGIVYQEDKKEIIDGEEITSSSIEWPTGFVSSKIQIGYTYKASTLIDKTVLLNDNIKNNFDSVTLDSVTEDHYIRIGDLLIATGTEGSNGYIEGILTWTHISSGYRADYVPELSANSVTDTSNNTWAEIKLTSAHANEGAGDLGIVSVVSNNESLTVNADNNAVKIGMIWGSF